MAEIYDFKRPEPKAAPKSEWLLPELYRVTGYEFDLTRTDAIPVASDRPAPVRYTLQDIDDMGLAQPRWEHITHLDPAKDTGMVVIRHHANLDRTLAYTLKEVDMLMCYDIPASTVFSTRGGMHTLTHYPKVPRGVPRHLLVYIRTEPGVDIEQIIGGDLSYCQYLIYHPDGSFTHDPDILYPRFR